MWKDFSGASLAVKQGSSSIQVKVLFGIFLYKEGVEARSVWFHHWEAGLKAYLFLCFRKGKGCWKTMCHTECENGYKPKLKH